jgi:hypothetical protein
MKKICFHGCVVLVGIIFFLPQLCFPHDNQLGRIVSVSGDSQVRRAKDKAWHKIQLHMPVYFGDTIRTRENSVVEITLVDKGSFKVHPNTQVALNTIISPVERRNSFLLFFGRMWMKVSKYAVRLKRYEIQTPTAIAGVRGTELGIASYEDGTTLVHVAAGRVTVDNESERKTLSRNEGATLSMHKREIKTERDFQPDWEQIQQDSRQRLFSDGEKYGSMVRSDIYERKEHLKKLIEKADRLSGEKKRYLSLADEAKASGDDLEYDSCMSEANVVNERIKELNTQIAFYGRRLECQFGLFYHYGYLARHPEYAQQFRGREFILKELDNIEMIHAEFNAMIEEGMKMSMEDMEDLMDEMKEKVNQYRQ